MPENPELAMPAGVTSGALAPPFADEVARELEQEPLPVREALTTELGGDQQPVEPPPVVRSETEIASVPNTVLDDALRGEERAFGMSVAPPPRRTGRRDRQRPPHGNALGMLIERHFTDPTSPCRSYSDLERRSGISREALSRYVTARPDRRRSPTIDTLVAIADAMHLSLESVSRAAAASVHGVIPPREEEQHAREEVLGTLVAGLTDVQFSAVVELLRHLRPALPTQS
ncbi:MAG: helix-turn-helix domain-containing protein [Ktedonobacterales bacterium]